jgi:hypothetical protein
MAKNIKIMTIDGIVTLEDWCRILAKASIEAKAHVAGIDRIDNQLEVTER